MFGPYKNIHHVINSSERSDILVFNSYLCHFRILLTCYVCSTKIGENLIYPSVLKTLFLRHLGFSQGIVLWN